MSSTDNTAMNREAIRQLITFVAVLVAQVIHHTVYILSVFKDDGVGQFNESAVFDQYPTEMTPSDWGSVVWQVVLPLQYAWVCNYAYFFAICMTDEKRQRQLFWSRILFCIGSFFNVLRIALFAYAQLTASFFMALVATVAMIPSAHLLTALPAAEPPSKCDACVLKFLRYFLNIACSALAGWTALYMLVLLAMTLVYESPIKATSEAAGTACLSIFLIAFCVLMFLHLRPFERISRHQYGFQIISIIAAACIYTNLEEGTRNSGFSLSLIIVTTVSLVGKAVHGAIHDRIERRMLVENLPILVA